MPDINGIPYVESSDLVSAYPAASQALAQEVSDQLASKLDIAGGKILQVVSTTKTDTYSESIAAGSYSSNVVTGLTASITPSDTSSLILVQVVTHISASSQYGYGSFVLRRGSTAIGLSATAGSRTSLTAVDGSYAHDSNDVAQVCAQYLDSPATTSSTTYGISLHQRATTPQTVYVNRSATDTDAVRFTRPISTITLMEVSA